MRSLASGIFLAVALVGSSQAQTPVPQFYGFYALSDGKLVELPSRPASALSGAFGISGVISEPPKAMFPDGKIVFVAYQRELALAAPDRVFVSIAARIRQERSVAWGGQVEVKNQNVGSWKVRDRGYNFRVLPHKDSKEAIIIRHEVADFVLPPGRYAIVFSDQVYDFQVAGTSSDPEHCVDWVATVNGAQFPLCPTQTPQAPPPQAKKSGPPPTVAEFRSNPAVWKDPSNAGYYYLTGDPRSGDQPYQIWFAEKFNLFRIGLYAKPLGKNRQEAEQRLLKILKIEPAAACSLNYSVATVRFVDADLAGEELGFSFCPGARTLP